MITHLVGPAIILTAGLCLIDQGHPQPGEKEKTTATNLSGLAVEITKVVDFDQIEGFVLSTPKRKVRITLANTMPLSKWPGELSKDETKIKQDALALLTAMVIGKEGEWLTFWGIDEGQELHGDLRGRDRGRAYKWNGNLPSGKLGWFTIHINAMLIENGYSVYAEAPKHLSIALTDLRGLDRAKLLMAAERHAAKSREGIWGLGKDSEFAKKLKSLASRS